MQVTQRRPRHAAAMNFTGARRWRSPSADAPGVPRRDKRANMPEPFPPPRPPRAPHVAQRIRAHLGVDPKIGLYASFTMAVAISFTRPTDRR